MESLHAGAELILGNKATEFLEIIGFNKLLIEKIGENSNKFIKFINSFRKDKIIGSPKTTFVLRSLSGHAVHTKARERSSSNVTLNRLPKAVVAVLKRLRHHARVTNRRQEVCVSIPPRKNVPVNMFRNPRSGSLAKPTEPKKIDPMLHQNPGAAKFLAVNRILLNPNFNGLRTASWNQTPSTPWHTTQTAA
jgi:hypothetical protein